MAGEEKPAQAPRKRRGPVPGTYEARQGGLAVRDKYGYEFYSDIGKKGGEVVKQKLGSEFYSRIGRAGGISTRNRMGLEFYERIGRIGGSRRRADRGDK